jgi:hypothetical protein
MALRYLAYAGIAAFLLAVARGFHERDVLGVFAELRQGTVGGTLSFVGGYALMLLAVVFACEILPALLRRWRRD